MNTNHFLVECNQIMILSSPRIGTTVIRIREAAKTGLRTSTAARSAFVTDFTAATRGSTRERRDSRRVVVGFVFKQ